jgi:hypothetical protein
MSANRSPLAGQAASSRQEIYCARLLRRFTRPTFICGTPKLSAAREPRYLIALIPVSEEGEFADWEEMSAPFQDLASLSFWKELVCRADGFPASFPFIRSGQIPRRGAIEFQA